MQRVIERGYGWGVSDEESRQGHVRSENIFYVRIQTRAIRTLGHNTRVYVLGKFDRNAPLSGTAVN